MRYPYGLIIGLMLLTAVKTEAFDLRVNSIKINAYRYEYSNGLEYKSIITASGVVIDAKTVLTTYHITQKGSELAVDIDGTPYPASIIKKMPERDQALLYVPDMPDIRHETVAELTPRQALNKIVYISGYPKGKSFKQIKGIITDMAGNNKPYAECYPIRILSDISHFEYMEKIFEGHNMQIRLDGMSGGAICLEDGRVIGIVTDRTVESDGSPGKLIGSPVKCLPDKR